MTDHARKLRLGDIARQLVDLLPEHMAKGTFDREAFLAEQTKLMDEQDELDKATGKDDWRPAGETVGQRWARLDDAGRRLWLLQTGKTWTVDHKKVTGEDGKVYGRHVINPNWATPKDKASVRERFTRPAA